MTYIDPADYPSFARASNRCLPMRRQAASTRRDLSITLQGEIGTILDWIDRTGKSGYKPKPDTASTRLLVSAKSGTLIRAIHLKKMDCRA